MGFLTEKYSRIIKAPYYMYFKESLEINRVVRSLRELHDLIEKLSGEVKEGEVRESIKSMKKVVKDAHAGLEADYKMAINVEVGEVVALDIIKKVEDEWERIKEDIKREDREKHERIVKMLQDIDLKMARTVVGAMKQAEGEDRDLYGITMNIVRAAEKTEETFMGKMRLYFKNLDVSRLQRWAGKFGALRVRKYVNELKRDKQEEERLIRELEDDLKIIRGKGKKKGDIKKEIEAEKDVEIVIKKFQELIIKLGNHIAKEFLEGYKVIKRDLMLIFILLTEMDIFKERIEYWKSEKVKRIPEIPAKKILEMVLEIEAKCSKHAHTIAQGLRVIFHTERALEARAKRI